MNKLKESAVSLEDVTRQYREMDESHDLSFTNLPGVLPDILRFFGDRLLIVDPRCNLELGLYTSSIAYSVAGIAHVDYPPKRIDEVYYDIFVNHPNQDDGAMSGRLRRPVELGEKVFVWEKR